MKIDYVGKNKIPYLVAFIILLFLTLGYYCLSHHMKFCGLSCLTMMMISLLVLVRDFVFNNVVIRITLTLMGMAALVLFAIGASFGELHQLSQDIAHTIVGFAQIEWVNTILRKITTVLKVFV